MKEAISKIFRILFKDSLYKNSLYLILSTAIMALLGFFFWIINARLFTTEQIGIGTTIISIMTLISNLSILGFGKGIIRYLSTSEKKNQKINTSFSMVLPVSILISVIFLIFIKTFSPKLLFIRENIVFAILFVLFIALSSLNTLSESVFIAYRSSKFVLIKNIIFSAIKLIIPVFLIVFGSFGIFMSVGIAGSIAFFLSFLFLILRFNYKPRPVIVPDVLRRIMKFSIGNYVAELIGGSPQMVLPILITNLIGAKFSAFFYMDMMIANLLYIIPIAISQSLFAEGAHSETELKAHLIKAAKIISIIIIPAIILIFFFGNYILLAFGKEYSYEGYILLRLLAISGIFIAINSIGSTILNLKYKIKLMIIVDVVTAVIILTISIIFLKLNLFGVIGVGIGWITGQGVTALIYLFLIRKFVR